MSKKTVVIGVSTNTERYSYKAVNKLLEYKHEVVPLGVKQGEVFGLSIINGLPLIENVHTVTLYLGKNNQEPIINYVVELNPKRVIFNPGTENEAFEQKLKSKGIEAIRACTLVMLATGVY